MKSLKSASLFALLFSAAPALAFDGNREGFILGFGAGLHTTRENFTTSDHRIDNGLATSFKIGAGLTDRLLLYYVRNISWFNAPYAVTGKNATYSIALSGIGTSIYSAPSAPSAYFQAAIGSGDISTPFEDSRPSTGSAILLGGGYEFRKNLMIEGAVLATNIPNGSTSLKSSSLQFTINYLFY